eukprot:SAG31_NODE_5256_length_2647_cov_1.875981_1_plen_70_part_10
MYTAVRPYPGTVLVPAPGENLLSCPLNFSTADVPAVGTHARASAGARGGPAVISIRVHSSSLGRSILSIG